MPVADTLSAWRDALADRTRPLRRWWRTRASRLVRLDARPTRLARDAVVVAMAMRNEAPRLPSFFAHYRRLGADRFIVVDNGSDDGGVELALAEPDCHVLRSDDDFRRARFGLDWIERAMGDLAPGRWLVDVDADELLDYPHAPSVSLRELVRFLQSEGARALPATLVDLYAAGPLSAAPPLGPGVDPLAAYPYFDRDGYLVERPFTPPPGLFAGMRSGGPRHRLFGTPCYLSKFPLYHLGPARVGGGMHVCTTDRVSQLHAAVLHLKLVAGFAPRVVAEARRDVHWGGSIEYKAYAQAITASPDLDPMCAVSERYRDWRSLAAHDLVRSSPAFEHFAARAR